MALLNEIIGVAARYQQLLSRRFGIAGGSPSPQLTPEVTPSYDIAQIGLPEGKILAGERYASATLFSAAAAANFSQVKLLNAPGTNIVAVVESIFIANVTAGALEFKVSCGFDQTAFPDLPGAGGITFTDFRNRGNAGGGYATAGPVCTVTGSRIAAVLLFTAANVFDGNVPANTAQVIDTPNVVLAPGSAVCASPAIVNTGLIVGYRWREVPLAAGEVGPF